MVSKISRLLLTCKAYLLNKRKKKIATILLSYYTNVDKEVSDCLDPASFFIIV